MSVGDAHDAGEMHLLVGETRQVEPSAIAEREADEPRALEGSATVERRPSRSRR